MIAAAAVSGAAWTTLVAAAVFLLALGVLVVDRTRMKRRLSDVERSEALLETDLADARRELAALRDCLRDRPGGATAAGGLRTTGSEPGESAAPVG